MDMDAVDQDQVLAIRDFCDLWLADKIPNQAVRSGGPDFHPEIGYAHYSQGRQAALRLFP
jgi:hypothetical protein